MYILGDGRPLNVLKNTTHYVVKGNQPTVTGAVKS